MLKHVFAWVDARTGFFASGKEGRDRPLPGGARWRYVFGASLAVLFLVEAVTGLLLMSSYSPSAATAWGSVYYLSYQTSFGWFVRGMHRFATTAMVVLVVLHVIQAVISRAYQSPREILWWSIAALLPLTMALGLTGNMLPWDQRGYWAANVETTIAGGTPVVGPTMQRLIVGGPRLGNLTLTRMYTLHVLVLPALFLLVLWLQRGQVRRHGEMPSGNSIEEPRSYWPNQVFRNAFVAALILAGLAIFVVLQKGASLDAPADPSGSDYPARPEWYVLWLNRLLSFLPGEYEIVGTVIVPTVIAMVLLSLPLLDRLFPKGFVHFLATGFLFAVVGSAGYLIYDGLNADRHNATFQASRRKADEQARRAVWLAENPQKAGIPPSGDANLLSADPLTRGMAVLEQKCLGCHAYGEKQPPLDAPYRGWDLKGYASKKWVGELLADPEAPRFRGHVPKAAGSKETSETPLSGMKEWKKSTALEPSELESIADFLARFSKTPSEATFEEWSENPTLKEHPGYQAFVDDCCQCHAVGNWGEKTKLKKAPALFGYGSPRWVSRMIRQPGSKGYYSYLKAHEQMPAFEDQLTPRDLEMVVRLLAEDYLEEQPNER